MTTVHLLRGRVAIRPDELTSYAIIVPGRDPKDRSGARTGTVVAMGPPAETPQHWRVCDNCRGYGEIDGDDASCPGCFGNGSCWTGGVEIPPGFKVGDRVVYVFGQINAALPDEPNLAWCAQEEILGVIDG